MTRENVSTDKLKNEPGANINYLRWRGQGVGSRISDVLATEIRRACDDIEAYREIVGLIKYGDDEKRLHELVEAMTWTP